MTTYRNIYCHYPVSKIIYSNDSFTHSFTGYLKEQLALFNEQPSKLENKKVCLCFNQDYNKTISDEDRNAAVRVYVKMKRLRAMYLQLTFYFKQFNIGSDDSINRYLIVLTRKVEEHKKNIEEFIIEYYSLYSQKQKNYLKIIITTLNKFVKLINSRTDTVKDVLRIRTPLPEDLFPVICEYIGH
jgi:hypothetical protein